MFAIALVTPALNVFTFIYYDPSLVASLGGCCSASRTGIFSGKREEKEDTLGWKVVLGHIRIDNDTTSSRLKSPLGI